MEDKSLTADAKSLERQLNMLGLTIDPKCNMPERHEVNTEKRDVRLRTSGFLASKTIGVDMTPLEAMDNYGMRDEQENASSSRKGRRDKTEPAAGRNRRNTAGCSSASSASFLHRMYGPSGEANDRLRSRFGSTESLLAETRTIRCIEHRGRMKLMTPFVGGQVEICKAFGFEIPTGSAPAYTSKAKSKTPKRGRPAAPKTESQEI